MSKDASNNELRSRTVTLGGTEYELKLTAGAIGLAHARGIPVSIDDEMRQSDIALGMHLLYIALQPQISKDVDKERVMQWLAERDDGEELCAWVIGQYMDASEAVKNSMAPRHQKMIQKRQDEVMNELLNRLGSSGMTSTGT